MDNKLHDLLHKLTTSAQNIEEDMDKDWKVFKEVLTELIIHIEELEKKRDGTTGYTEVSDE